MTTNIVFSKDRPWQLSEYLRTRKKFILGINNTFVIYKTNDIKNEYQYRQLILQHPDITFFREDDLNSFSKLLRTSIRESDDYILFGVDDVLFYNYFDTKNIDLIFKEINCLFSLSLRLNPNISYCQPANVHCEPPHRSEMKNFYISYFDSWGKHGDWGYPFEVSASIYRKNDILDLLDEILVREGEIGYSHPNRFEGAGAMISMNNPKYRFMACCNEPICSTITVNRVQDVCQNPLAGSELSQESSQKLFTLKAQYDEDWYKKQIFNQIHIGNFVLKEVFSW